MTKKGETITANGPANAVNALADLVNAHIKQDKETVVINSAKFGGGLALYEALICVAVLLAGFLLVSRGFAFDFPIES